MTFVIKRLQAIETMQNAKSGKGEGVFFFLVEELKWWFYYSFPGITGESVRNRLQILCHISKSKTKGTYNGNNVPLYQHKIVATTLIISTIIITLLLLNPVILFLSPKCFFSLFALVWSSSSYGIETGECRFVKQKSVITYEVK